MTLMAMVRVKITYDQTGNSHTSCRFAHRH